MGAAPMLAKFLDKVRDSLEARAFVKITLSQPRAGAEAGLRKLKGRVVELKEGRQLSLVWRYVTRDVTKNLPFAEGCRRLEAALQMDFERGTLFTVSGDWHYWDRSDGAPVLKASRPAFVAAPEEGHDRQKHHAIAAAGSGYLQALGVVDARGEPRPGRADKLRQIQRFAEILGHLLDETPALQRKDGAVRVVDMGAGKGYLTFATADLLRQRGIAAEVRGIEMREELTKLTNGVAHECGFPQLRFVPGSIGDHGPAHAADLLIALHACDTATDDAIFQGIQAGASLIVTAPCCHKEVRRQMRAPASLSEVLRHGILLEREAEILTDGLRALLLEIHGYQAQVFEFVSNEHTGKNLMITARKTAAATDVDRLREQLRGVLQEYGIREQRLAKLLGEM